MNKRFDRGGGQKQGGKKNNKKQFFRQQQAKTHRDSEIKDGIKGFLLTCDVNAEKRAIKEIFNLLNAYVEKLYPSLDK